MLDRLVCARRLGAIGAMKFFEFFAFVGDPFHQIDVALALTTRRFDLLQKESLSAKPTSSIREKYTFYKLHYTQNGQDLFHIMEITFAPRGRSLPRTRVRLQNVGLRARAVHSARRHVKV